MIDSHCHLADEAFVPDLQDVVARAHTAGVREALCILDAGDESELRRAGALSAAWPALRFAVGVHPHHAGRYSGRPEAALEDTRAAVIGVAGVRAVGEIGLDYHYNRAPRDLQREVFRCQLELARALDLPVVIHTREADEDTFAMLETIGAGALRGIFHCFTGDPARARRVLELGFHVSVAGIVTFPRAESVREAARVVPDDRLLVETDSPYLAPVPNRGKRNEPAWVARVVETLAAVRSTPVETLAAGTERTYAALIRP